ncbi:MAG: GNAT family N-acetyltransferase [Streptosporangiales bacterium]|nr:GNAT family N-acetyltransferase [Streptosporangiales bacterium]
MDDRLPRSPRLLYRRPAVADEEKVRDLRQDPEVMRYVGGPLTSRSAAERFSHDLAHWDEHGYGKCVVLDRDTESFVGLCGLQEFEGEPDLGYLLAPQWWGRGLATEIAAASLRCGFEDLHAPLVRALVQAANLASQRVLGKVGMRYLGDRFLWGERQRRYAITAGEWDARRAEGSDLLADLDARWR